MQYELTIHSTVTARFDGTLDDAVNEALAEAKGRVPTLALTYTEGGSMSGPGVAAETAAENHFGIEVPDETAAQTVALIVANRLARPVKYYRYGNDVDPATTAHFTMHPGDLPAALGLTRTPDRSATDG